MAETLDPKVTVGLLIVRLPSAPATADPIVTLVVEPNSPALPMFTDLVTPLDPVAQPAQRSIIGQRRADIGRQRIEQSIAPSPRLDHHLQFRPMLIEIGQR